jgi:hypothetical protein
MADKPRTTEPPKSETEKKQSETVHLTPEELRKISGGTSIPITNPLKPNSPQR